MSPAPIPLPLRPARVHEAGGPLAAAFAAVSVAQCCGPVLWVREAWRADHLHPRGLADFFDPARLLLAQTDGQTDSLAVTEEALRDGSLPLVVTELTGPLSLTQGRRLQLAAQAGPATGLCLIPETMGSNAAETRWHCAPLPDAGAGAGAGADTDGGDSTLQCWRLTKNKSGTLGVWHVRWDRTAHRIIVVSPAGE